MISVVDEPEIEHIIIPSLTISGKDIVKDLLPHRLHPHSKYFENYTSFIVCTLCNMNIGVNTKCLMKHILNVPHSQWADVKLPKFTFFCEICNTRFTDDINWEKHFTGGPNRYKNCINWTYKNMSVRAGLISGSGVSKQCFSSTNTPEYFLYRWK